MTILARFFLVIPQFSHAYFKIKPYHTYDLVDHYPETLFNQRIEEIELATKDLYPTVISDYLAFWIGIVASFITCFLIVGSSLSFIIIICILGPFSVWVWTIWQKRNGPNRLNNFETIMHALLEAYTSSDLATYSISWLLLTTTEPEPETTFEPDSGDPYSTCRYYIDIILRDPDSVPEDPLPLYLTQNENETPPDYGLPEYELKTVKVDKGIDLGQATHASVEGLNAEDVQRVLTHAPGRAGLTEEDITDARSKRAGLRVEGTTPRAKDLVEGDRP